MFCCAVDCLSPVLSCKAASSNQQGTERFQNEGTLGVVQREDSKYTCNVCPASALAISQQGNKSCYCLLVLCPARSATAYLVPLSLRHFRVFFYCWVTVMLAFSASPSLPLRNASIYLVIECECLGSKSLPIEVRYI